jgi:hypothetical protein
MRITNDPAAEARRWINDGGGGGYPAVFINGFVNMAQDAVLHTMCLEVI